YNPQNEMYQFSKRNVHFLSGAKVIKKHGYAVWLSVFFLPIHII
ncbi:hypothetical protein HMPREF9073_00154, partial [Capnocytophaga sp. oral taxon 326 str. F0382]